MQPSRSLDAERCTRLTQGARAKQVMEAAVRLFAQKGFQGTKTKEIAEAAGVNEALIFRDFQSKEKLYCAALDHFSSHLRTEQWVEELTEVAKQRNDEVLFTEIAMKFLERFGQDPVLIRVMLFSSLEQHESAGKFRDRQLGPLERFIEDYVSTRQREGAFRQGDPHNLARCFISMCHNRMIRQVLFGRAIEPSADADAARIFTQVFLNGVLSH